MEKGTVSTLSSAAQCDYLAARLAGPLAATQQYHTWRWKNGMVESTLIHGGELIFPFLTFIYGVKR